MKYKHKFDYDDFVSEGGSCFVVSKERYSKEEAIKIIAEQIEQKVIPERIETMFVRYGYGYNHIHNEPQYGLWLEPQFRKRSCPVWAYEYY